MLTDPKRIPSGHPLRQAWDAYGHAARWPEDIVSLRWRRDGCYVLVLFSIKGELGIADLAAPGRGGPWEMQNDSGEIASLGEWRKVRIVPGCDWYRLPEDDDYPRRSG